MQKTLLLIFLLIPSIVFGETTASLQNGSNIDLTFFIVEHSSERGNIYKFSSNKVSGDPDAVIQDFSIFISSIVPDTEVGVIEGMLKIGDEIWSFTTKNIVKISNGRLIVNTKLNIKDGEKGSAELVSKEPYNTVKTIGNQPQNVVEFIDIGIKIEAEPKILENGLIQVKIILSVSEVLRESGKERDTNVPVVSTRDINTTIDFEVGKLEILSELTIGKKIITKSGFPYLRNIPLLGRAIFSYSREFSVNTKLYIVGGVSFSKTNRIKEFEDFKRKIEIENQKVQKYK